MKLIVACVIFFLVYFIQSFLYDRYWNKNLRINIAFEEQYVSEGMKSYLIETVENDKALPIPLLHVKFATTRYFLFQKETNTQISDQFYRHNLYSIAPHQKITRKYPFFCAKRGYYPITRADVVSRNLFLSDLLAAQYTCDTAIFVLPQILTESSIPESIRTSLQTIVHKSAHIEDPFEFKGIREYQPYDNYRMINWKSTARTNQLQVNTHFPTTFYEVDILLNLDTQVLAHADILQEKSIRIAYTIASLLCSSHASFRLISNGLDCFTQQPCVHKVGGGSNHLKQLGIALSRIDLTKPIENFTNVLTEYSKQATYQRQSILISNNRKKDIQIAYKTLQQKNLSCLYLIPEFANIPVEETLGINRTVWEVNYDEKTVSNL